VLRINIKKLRLLKIQTHKTTNKHLRTPQTSCLNSAIQAAKRKVRGYEKKHFKTMAYLLSEKLDLHRINGFLPTCF
jgi:hypothetical protein